MCCDSWGRKESGTTEQLNNKTTVGTATESPTNNKEQKEKDRAMEAF